MKISESDIEFNKICDMLYVMQLVLHVSWALLSINIFKN
jgi:hypothetical protein